MELKRTKRRFELQRRRNLFAKPGPHSLSIVVDNLKKDFNIGKIFRSADALGIESVHLIGVPFFNPLPAKGSFKHVPAKFYNDISACYQALKAEGKTIYALDVHESKSLEKISFAENAAIIVGHEEFGLSSEWQQFSDIQRVKIPQFGKVESMNVSVAVSIAMYEYVRQHSFKGEK